MARIYRDTLPVVDALAERIEQLGLSNRQAADHLDVSPGTVGNWLKGNVTPPLNADTQQAIASFLQCSPRRVVELFTLSLDEEEMRGYVTSPAA